MCYPYLVIYILFKFSIALYLAGMEEKVTKFLQAARNLEADFLAKQFYSRVQHPQEVEKQVFNLYR